MEWNDCRHAGLLDIQFRLLLEGRVGRRDNDPHANDEDEPFADGEFDTLVASVPVCPRLPKQGSRVFLRVAPGIWLDSVATTRWTLPVAGSDSVQLTFVEIAPVRHPSWFRWVMWPDPTNVADAPPPLAVTVVPDGMLPATDVMTRDVESMLARYWAKGGHEYFCTRIGPDAWRPKLTLRALLHELAPSKVA